MKNASYILGSLLMISSFGSIAQELDPDQNPNYAASAQKYAEKSDELTANQGETIQETYKAYDWRESKEEAKQQRLDRRYELRKLRIQSRHHHNGYYNGYNSGYYNNGYNNGYNNNNNGYYNNGYYNNGNSNCNSGYYNNNYFTPNVGGLLLGTGIGLGLHYLWH